MSGPDKDPGPGQGQNGSSVDHPERPSPPQIPDHQLLRRIGMGSYGEVWLARNIMGSYRAVKLVYRENFDHDRPFEREFNGIQKFEPVSRSHPSQVNILHVGRGEGYFFYVMELADDETSAQNISPESYAPRTLRSELFHRGRLPAQECLEISLALSTALGHLHQHELVHRDIKPSNIIFVNGIPKLADIGLVTSADATRSYVGTEGFVPPEGPGTPTADIYSLGKVMYEMCTGRDRQDFPELPTRLPELPDRPLLLELNAIVARACHHEPGKRYHAAAELHSDLVLLQSGESVAHLHLVERRLAKLKRASLIGATVTALAVAAFLWQSHESHQMGHLAAQNLDLAKRSRQAESESRDRLRQLQVVNGTRAMDEGDFSSSLLWFTEALKSKGEPSQEEADRYRLGALFHYYPRLMAIHPAHGMGGFLAPDGSRVTIFGLRKDGADAEVWEVATGAVIHVPPDTNAWGGGIQSGGRFVLSVGRGSIRIWDALLGRNVPFPKPEANILRAQLSPDGSRMVLVTAATGTRRQSPNGGVVGPTREIVPPADAKVARLWDVPSGTPIGPPWQHQEAVGLIVFTRDGSRVVTADGPRGLGVTNVGAARIWDTRTGEPVTDWLPHPEPVGMAEFSPDGRKLVTAGKRVTSTDSRRLTTAWVWDVNSGRLLHAAIHHEDSIKWVGFSPDGRYIATTSSDQIAGIWHANIGARATPPLKLAELVGPGAFTPDGRRLLTIAGGTARFWNVATGEPVAPPIKHPGAITSFELSADGGRLLTSCQDGLFRVWDLTVSHTTLPSMPECSVISGVAFGPQDGSVLAVDFYGHLQLWSTATERLLRPPFGTPCEPTNRFDWGYGRNAQFSPDGSLIAAPAGEREVRLWDARTAEPHGRSMDHSKEVVKVTFSPDGHRLVTACMDGTARVWDAANGVPVTAPLLHSNAVACATFSPDGRLVVTASGKTAQIWDAVTGTAIAPGLQHPAGVYSAEFSPDGRSLVTAGDAFNVVIWDVASLKKLFELRHGSSVFQASFSPDGQRVLTASADCTARVWNSATGKPVAAPLRHEGAVQVAVFSADGRRVLTASADRSVRVWDAGTGQPLTPALKHNAEVGDVCFSADGRRVLSAAGANAEIWEVPKLDWPVDEISMLTELSAGGTRDASGAILGSGADRLEQVWRALRTNHPAQFTAGREDLARWHRSEMVASEAGLDWFAALFHADRLLELDAADAETHTERRSILAHRPLPRVPGTGAELIDLSDFYNTALTEPFGYRGADLAGLPTGVQTLGGVRFDLRGAIRLGVENAMFLSSRRRHPSEVVGIPVNQSCHRLHFLHASEGERRFEGLKLGSYIVHYANGQQCEIPIHYGADLRNWLWDSDEPVSTINAVVAWKGYNQRDREEQTSVRLYRRTWENPSPGIQVASLDIVTSSREAQPFLIAITAE